MSDRSGAVDPEWDDGLESHRYVVSAGTRLHYAERGSGPPVVLLHGIPESWSTWRRYIVALAAAGYQAMAPDLRGYNLSDKPRSVSAYRGAVLAEDVAAIIRAGGHERASVVGQSWGGLAAWLFAMHYPEMLKRLVIMNVPHPSRWVEALRTWRFWRANSQMLLFQLPIVPEVMLRARNYAALRRSFERDLGGTGDVGTEEYIRAMAQRGALTGALNYYRAFLRENPFRLGWSLGVIDAPVLVIWGGLDRYFPVDLAQPPRSYVPNGHIEIVSGARHWAHRDQGELVQALLLDFLKGPGPEA
ncbi:MAG: alpha/beta fold hydrolase [Actinomycetota bacterium]